MADLSVLSQHLDYVFLFFIRISGLLTSSPIFGRRNVPNLMKVGFCLMLTATLIIGAPQPQEYPVYGTLLEYVLICLREMLFGVAMGFVLTTMFSIALTAGSMMDYQIGFSMASMYDLQTNTQTPLSGSLLNFTLLIMFFAYDGHLKLIEILARTLEACPVGTAMVPFEIMWVAADVMVSSFALAVMLAMPVMAAGMLLEIALGVIIRTVPQLNMFVVGIPLKLIVGLVMLIITLSLFVSFTKGVFSKAFDYIGLMFNSLQGIG